MRIAFFGGSFDPPHIGHLRIARAAAGRLHLDRVLLAPVALQPLKRDGPPPASYQDRLAMLRMLLGTDCNSNMEVSELDAPRPDGRPNYSYDTLLQLRTMLAPADQLFMLLGADSFLSMRYWHQASELLLLAEWIIAARPGFLLDELDEALPPSIRPAGPAKQRDGCITQPLTAQDGRTTLLYLLSDLREDVSATEIRTALAASPGTLPQRPQQEQVLAPAVIAYIRSHNLYR